MSELIRPYGWQEPLVRAVLAGLSTFRLFISGFPTGSGKTVISLAAAMETGRPHLVIAPKVALTQWIRMAEAMGCRDLLAGVINPEQISKPGGCGFYTRKGKWKLPKGAVVIWDEPHRAASGTESVSTRALAELRGYTGVCVHAMSATIADSPLKLRALGFLAGLHRYNDDSFYGWCREHGCDVEYVDRFKTRKAFRFTRDPLAAGFHMGEIRKSFGKMFLSVRAEDIPGFPDQTLETRLLDLGARDKAEAARLLESMSERMRRRAKSDMAEVGRERERVEWLMTAAVADTAAGLIADGNSVVVFFNFTEPRRKFEETMRSLGIEVSGVYGGQGDAERQESIDAFQRNSVPCISVMSEAGGAALSLHDERHERPRVSLIMPGYNSSTVKQCLGRIRRCNGTHATQYFVLAAGTVHERVAASMNRKLRNLDTFNETLCDEDLII